MFVMMISNIYVMFSRLASFEKEKYFEKKNFSDLSLQKKFLTNVVWKKKLWF